MVTPPTFQGCDKLSVTERRRNRQGVQVEVVEFPFDWRLTLAPHCVWCSADVAFAYRLWDKAQAGAVVDAPDHQIAQVVQRVIDGQTGAVSVAPEPKRMWRHAPGQSHGGALRAADQADRADLEPRSTLRPRPAVLAAPLAARKSGSGDRLRGPSV